MYQSFHGRSRFYAVNSTPLKPFCFVSYAKFVRHLAVLLFLFFILGALPAAAATDIIDNGDPAFTTVGNWSHSTARSNYYGSDYQHMPTGDGAATASWSFNIPTAGRYEIYASWTTDPNRAPDAPYTLSNNGIRLGTVRVDQTTTNAQFNLLGTFDLNSGELEVTLSNAASNGYVIADAVQIIYVGKTGIIDNGDPAFTTVGNWSHSTARSNYYGSDYQHMPTGDGAATASWSFNIPTAGRYEIYASWTTDPNRAPDAPYTLSNNGIRLGTVRVDQTTTNAQFNLLGTFDLNSGELEVTLSNAASNGYVIADAVQIIYVGKTGIIDNGDPAFTTVGNWSHSTARSNYYGSDYQHMPTGDGAATASWSFNIPTAGRYEIYASWTTDPNRAPDAPYTLSNNGIRLGTVRVDQTTTNAQFNLLGTFDLNSGELEVTLSNAASNGYVIADAVQIIYVGKTGIIDNGDPAFTTVGNWSHSTARSNYYGSDYQHMPTGDGAATASWSFNIPTAGRYEIYASWTTDPNRAPDAPYTLSNNGIRLGTVRVDQTTTNAQFNLLGTFDLNSGELEVTLSNAASNDYVIADAVQIIYVGDSSTIDPDTSTVTIDPDTSANIDVLGGTNGTVTLIDSPSNGTAFVEADNTITYTPNNGYSGQDSFSYKLTDANGNITIATLTIKVGCTDCLANVNLTLSWDPNPEEVLGYYVYYGTSSGTATQPLSDLDIASGKVDSQAPFVTYNAGTDLGLHAGDLVCFQVKAYNSVGESDFSAPTCAEI